MMGAQLMDIADLSAMLAGRIENLCMHLLPNGVRDGHEWRIGSLAGEAGRSMAVRIRGATAGVWKDFASGEAGDALDLVAGVLFHDDKAEAVKWARSWLGVDQLDPARLAQKRREVRAEADRKEKEARDQADKMLSSARRLWHMAQPEILKTPVYHYLLLRGIDINALPRVPGALRYEPQCWCAETQTKLPAMVAAIQNGAGKQIATHRTYLQRQHDGTWKKASLVEAKKTLAAFRGGFIALNRGESGRPLRDAPDGDHVYLAEGIETALSLAVELPEKRVLAGVSCGNFQNLELPEQIRDVTIAADNDGENAQTLKALDNAITRFVREGRRVRVIRSPIGKDFNDLLQWQKRALIENARKMS